MNIFFLSSDLRLCAIYHCNSHVVKMILEYAQLLSTAHQILDGKNDLLYKATHVNHPCAIWVRQSSKNYDILYKLFKHLCAEYTYRYGKVHKTQTKLLDLLKNPPANIPIGKSTLPPLAMNDESKIIVDGVPKVIESYRRYYITQKSHFAVWTGRPVPYWFNSQ